MSLKPDWFLPAVTWTILPLMLLLGSCLPKSNISATAYKYHISGIIADSQDGDTLLLGVVGNARRINKAIIKHGKFRFKGTVPELSMGVIQYKHSFNITGTSAFVIEKAPIVIAASVDPGDSDYADGRIVKAGEQNEYLKELMAILDPFKKEMNEASLKIQKAQQTNNPEEAKFYRDQNLKAFQKISLTREEFIKTHPNSLAALYGFYNSLDYKMLGSEKSMATLNLFDEQIKKTSLWMKVKELAEQEATTKSGSQ
ncbi:MAG: hypothetical protein JWQ14_1760 [Adhaeribacter sp.]|nr:hypothetical protein [Adhaeribacter sp.]